MTVDGQKGLQQLLEMIKGLKGNTLSSMLDKSNLSDEDKKAISALFEQFNEEQRLDGTNQQNALAIIQKLFQQSKAEGKKEKINTILNKFGQNADLNDGDKKVVDELKKLL